MNFYIIYFLKNVPGVIIIYLKCVRRWSNGMQVAVIDQGIISSQVSTEAVETECGLHWVTW